jgi:hypothetical protein
LPAMMGVCLRVRTCVHACVCDALCVAGRGDAPALLLENSVLPTAATGAARGAEAAPARPRGSSDPGRVSVVALQVHRQHADRAGGAQVCSARGAAPRAHTMCATCVSARACRLASAAFIQRVYRGWRGRRRARLLSKIKHVEIARAHHTAATKGRREALRRRAAATKIQVHAAALALRCAAPHASPQSCMHT